MDIEAALFQIGLSKNQIKVYLTLLQLGEATIQEITAKSKIKRTSVYHSLDNLAARNLVTFQDKGWHRQYYAENPKKVLLTFKEEQQASIAKEKKFLVILPELVSLYNVKAEKPKIRYFEGIEGIKQIYEETLLLKHGEEMLGYGSAVMLEKYLGDEWLKNYWQTRIKRKIFVKAILEDSEIGRAYQESDKKFFRQTLLVSKEKFPFTNFVNIFGNKIYIISFEHLLGVIIDSADITQTQRSFFNLAWEAAGKYNAKRKTPSQ